MKGWKTNGSEPGMGRRGRASIETETALHGRDNESGQGRCTGHLHVIPREPLCILLHFALCPRRLTFTDYKDDNLDPGFQLGSAYRRHWQETGGWYTDPLPPPTLTFHVWGSGPDTRYY